MCGIAGFITEGQDNQASIINLMLDKIKHRGPDDSATVVGDKWAIGVNRLSITAPNEIQTQPIWSEDRRYCFVFNGQIYNYKNVRRQLENKRIKFITQCDAEVLFKAFLFYGVDAFLICHGMFACAIWDNHIKSWMLARDPVGIKPLYYIKNKNSFYFASEIKALLSFLNSREINHTVVPEYLMHRYVSGENTLFKNVFKVLPGYVLNTNGLLIESTKYYKVPCQVSRSGDSDKSLSELLNESIKSTIPSEVDFCTMLSGGIDSSIVTSVVKKYKSNFTSIFFDNNYDRQERIAANYIADELKLNLHEIKASGTDFKLLPEAIYALEEPIGDSIIAANLRLLKEARKFGKVVLTGEGADEILGGYAHHVIYRLAKIYSIFYCHRTVNFTIKLLPKNLINKIIPYPATLSKIELLDRAENLNNTINYGNLDYTNLFSHKELLDLNFDFKDHIITKDAKSFRDLITSELTSWLSNYNLLRLDKLGMSQSIEVRVPFLNLDLLNYCLSLPDSELINVIGQRKAILKKAAVNYLDIPKKIALRIKHPFTYKETNYKQSDYFNFCNDFLNSNFYNEFGINEKNCNNQIINDNFLSNKKKASLLNLAIWHREFFN